MGYWLYCGCS